MCRLPQWAFTRAGTQPSVFLRSIPDVCIWEQPDTCVCPHRRLSHADRERPVARDPAPSRGGGASHFTPNASQGSRTWSFREPQGFAVTALMSDFCFEGRFRNTALPGTGSEDHQAGLSHHLFLRTFSHLGGPRLAQRPGHLGGGLRLQIRGQS